MPLIVSLVVLFAVGLLGPLAAARELRASPRAAYQTRAFRVLLAHVLAVALPIVTVLLARHADWMVSYVLDGAHIPSVVTAGVILVAGLIAIGGFWLGTRWLREHHAERVRYTVAGLGLAGILGAVLARHRLAVVGTYAQYHGQFAARGTGGAGAALIGAAVVWGLAAAHLFWTLRSPE